MRKSPKRKVGRPAKPPAEKQKERITVYLTKAEKRRFEALARDRGVSLATVVMLPWRE